MALDHVLGFHYRLANLPEVILHGTEPTIPTSFTGGAYRFPCSYPGTWQ